MQRVVVFIDYQNTYREARRAFHRDRGPAELEQFWPDAVGDELCRRADNGSDRVLQQVRVYRGVPSPQQNRVGNQAARKQIERWKRDAKVEVFTHLLRGVPGGLREKGVDVNLAVDLVHGAHLDQLDVAIVFSRDADFMPAIRLVNGMGLTAEVAAWWNPPHQRHRLGHDEHVYCHWLDRSAYRRVRDLTRYISI